MTTRIHARKLAARALLLFACLSWGLDPAWGEVSDLVVSKSGENAVLTWTTGTPLFRVLRSESPDFVFGNRLAAQGLTAGAFTDVEALAPGRPSYYYLVLEDGQADPPGFILNPPRPVPFISMLTPDAGRVGDVVTIDGGNFSADGSAMSVTFDGWPADVLTTSADQLTVEVPEDALTGDVQVCVAGVCSNRVLFKLIVGPAFINLSSMAFEPGTGSLWVADGGMVGTTGTVYEIDATGGVVARGTLARALLGHPSPGDGTGRIYYCNSSPSDTNFGTIEYIDSMTNAEVFFDRAGDSAGQTQAVRCEGIAANDLESDVVYFLDGRGNTVRRIVRNALAHDLMYGDQPFTFNSPAGARFDSAGNLYLSSTTAIYKILPQEAGVELVASGFTAAAGIDLSEDTGILLLLVADEATGKVWLVNGETGEKEVVGSGFSGPVAVAFSQNSSAVAGLEGSMQAAGSYAVGEPARVTSQSDPTIEFKETGDVRVLLSTSGEGAEKYPIGRQIGDGKIEVRIEVLDLMYPEGTTVHFRLVDPKDPSRYLNGRKNDNLPTSPGGTLTPLSVQLGSDGKATTVLHVAPAPSDVPQYAGNNYIVEASLDPNFRKKPKSSKMYTSWRRLYIEHDRMYESGEFVVQERPSGQNPVQVFVANRATFSPGDRVHLISGDSPSTAVGELGAVQEIPANEAYLTVNFDGGKLEQDYGSAGASFPADQFPYTFLAKINGGSHGAALDLAKLNKVFGDAFTEWIVLPQQGSVPYWPYAPGAPGDPDPRTAYLDARSFTFFEHFDRSTGRPMKNHVQVISGRQYEDQVPPKNQDPIYGLAVASGGAANWVWIFHDTIARDHLNNLDNARAHVLEHELGHQLNVNDPANFGHDAEKSWNDPGRFCVMEGLPDDTNGEVRFHFVNPADPYQDLLCIRTHVDDLSQDICPPPYPGNIP